MSTRAWAARAVAGSVLVFVAGCSTGDPVESGEQLIETELRDQIGLGDLDAICDQPDEAAGGAVFTCTATTEDGRTIDFRAEFESDTDIFVYPVNVVTADVMPAVEQEAAEVLGPEVGAQIDPSAVECPLVNTVLDEAGRFFCTIADESTGEVYDLQVTFGGFERDEGFTERSYLIVGLTAE